MQESETKSKDFETTRTQELGPCCSKAIGNDLML